MNGKPSNFTAEQVQALRRALREFHERQQKIVPEGWSQDKTAKRIGVSQQVAGRLLGKEVAGLSFPTASAIAALEGFDSLDEFFRAHDPSAVDPTAERGDRGLAVNLARRAGLADGAIEAVLARYATSQYDNRPTKWWIAKFIAEDDDRDIARPPPPPPATPAAQPAPATAPRRARARKAG